MPRFGAIFRLAIQLQDSIAKLSVFWVSIGVQFFEEGFKRMAQTSLTTFSLHQERTLAWHVLDVEG
jgi:hypothetical protein